ncbi:hypothetical protein ABMA28_003867 [Loxostege sticticalis]|uniref:Uncharacterized protein n=1 Tax=Loxostege sticticalis TaxID=481309 RepID=A0ABD0STB1_LOXSC
MDSGFSKANSNNLPRIDVVMLGKFFASNSDFCSSEFRNVKTSIRHDSFERFRGKSNIIFAKYKLKMDIFSKKKICFMYNGYKVRVNVCSAASNYCACTCMVIKFKF